MPHLPTLLAQIFVIPFAARTIGWLLRQVHQPQVVGFTMMVIMALVTTLMTAPLLQAIYATPAERDAAARVPERVV